MERRHWPEGPLSLRADSRNPSQSAIGQWDWGLPTLWGGIEPGDFSVRPRVVGIVEVWKGFPPVDGNVSSPAAAEPRRWPDGQPSPRAGLISPNQSPIGRWDWGFKTLPGRIDPGDLRLRPRVVGRVEIF